MDFSFRQSLYGKIPHQFRKQIIPNITGEAPGTIVVNTGEHFLCLTRDGGMQSAMGSVLAGPDLNGIRARPCAIQAAMAAMDTACGHDPPSA